MFLLYALGALILFLAIGFLIGDYADYKSNSAYASVLWRPLFDWLERRKQRREARLQPARDAATIAAAAKEEPWWKRPGKHRCKLVEMPVGALFLYRNECGLYFCRRISSEECRTKNPYAADVVDRDPINFVPIEYALWHKNNEANSAYLDESIPLAEHPGLKLWRGHDACGTSYGYLNAVYPLLKELEIIDRMHP